MRRGSGWRRYCLRIRVMVTRGNDHRTVINGIFFRARTSCSWRDLPGEFGNW